MNKKQVILTGQLAAPLCEGCRAWIRHSSGLICTSRVVRIQSFSDRKAVFETVNSLYHVSLETSLDKGTQRKTTENELPSLTQCTA